VIDSVFKHSVDLGFNYFDILTGAEKQRENKMGGEIIRSNMGLQDLTLLLNPAYRQPLCWLNKLFIESKVNMD